MSAMDPEAQKTMDSFPAFEDRVDVLNASTNEILEIMQVNVGRRCNLMCKHCHIDAGPDRTESMAKETMQACLDVFGDRAFKKMDITGGAPELNPHFEWLLDEAAKRDVAMMVRSNLVILENEGFRHLPRLYADYGVAIVASLPHYTQKAMEKQRGSDTYDAVIRVLKELNVLGYGKDGGLELDLVYNPGGAYMPPDQSAIEREYKEKLADQYGIVFDNLFAITNNPLGRFGSFLQRSGNLEGYMGRLIGSFNAATLPAMMCRNQVSVGWDGRLFDCDFNQAADLPCMEGLTIGGLARDGSIPLKRKIRFGNHCYACCAGSGSSCGGATA